MNSAPVTGTDVSSWVASLLQAGDSFYPTGSYAHSFGLEGLVQNGIVHDRESLRQFFLRSTLPALRQLELPLVAQAFRAFQASDWMSIGELCELASASRTALEARLASEKIGRQRAELVASLHHSALAAEFLRRAEADHWPYSAPVSAALEGCALGAPETAVLAGFHYATYAAILSAAMKLLRLGQNASQTLLTEMLGHTAATVAAARAVPRSDIGWFNPWLDIAAARHEIADARMFIS
ncbi:MAG TPA: urease accessory UreF family protein [Candidatus Didemnitutus sp.]|nr:urease accessory UreF family protein [Candidatus Didemnitutus sp.]